MPRTSLKANVAKKPAATEAAKVAKKLVVDPGPPHTEEEYYETVSYNLPIDLIDLPAQLFDGRLKVTLAAACFLRLECWIRVFCLHVCSIS